ncbi:phosphoglycerate mutase [Mycobacterium dioxanotrophicus]|uniref:Phosphoglycerate mutase n=2 Tax=Mycobacterium dioxanotrophicus TaxID=482462 RepID=A0A1Y0CB35_9MYCO|nr:phosphoglycerate mutase [Mycobacterium dioxanotrophicus]
MAFLALCLALPVANAAEVMRVTFIRHGESYGNTSGLIDTSTPGPVLTPKGQQQAQDVAKKLGDNNYDAIYASTMVRTQLTAAPMSQYLGLPIQVLPGLQEIEAGDYEGTPEKDAMNGYLKAPIAWAFAGQRGARIPGSIDGNEFDARVDGALQTMYDNGDRNVAVFSHGGTIMFWTMMNAQNLSTADKVRLLTTHPLTNTSYVVIEGNPEDGWTLVDWDGEKFGTQPSFETNVQLQVRTLTRQLQQAADSVKAAFATRNPATIATAINHAVATASFSVVKFGRAINAEVINRTKDAVPTDADSAQKKVSAAVDTVKASVEANVKNVEETVDSAVGTQSLTGAAKLNTGAGRSKAHGATDLSDGNKALPGVTKSISRSGDRVREAVQNTSDQVATSVQKLSDAVKKITGQRGKSGAPADSAKTGGEKDAA